MVKFSSNRSNFMKFEKRQSSLFVTLKLYAFRLAMNASFVSISETKDSVKLKGNIGAIGFLKSCFAIGLVCQRLESFAFDRKKL